MRYANFACTANRSRGDAICASSSSLSERKITSALLAGLRDSIGSPEFAAAFVRGFERRYKERARRPASGTDLGCQLREAESRVSNLVAAIARMPDSEALCSQLSIEESTVKRLRSEVAPGHPRRRGSCPRLPRSSRPSPACWSHWNARRPSAVARSSRASSPVKLTCRKDDAPGTWNVTGAVRLRDLVAVSANFSSGGVISRANTWQLFRIVLG